MLNPNNGVGSSAADFIQYKDKAMIKRDGAKNS